MTGEREAKQPVHRGTLHRVAVAALIVACGVSWLYAYRTKKGLPYHDDFADHSLREWVPYGGNWQVSEGSVTNQSNESGSRLLTGNEDLMNYRMEADVRLTNSYGDAGLVFRVTDSEKGTNAFYGYYATMRLPDELVLARMDYGFQPLRIVKLPQPIHPGTWYHLSIEVRGCHVLVRARTDDGRPLAEAETEDSAECQPRGNFGLRSFAAGGTWRHVDVQALR